MKQVILTIAIITVSMPVVHAQWTTSGSDIYYNSGSVGIGTTSPLAKLSVHSSGTIGLSGTYANSSIYITDGTQQLGIDPNQIYAAQELTLTAATGYLGFITSGVERIRVLNNGNVGIGTTNPIAKLHVNGDTYLGTNQLQFLSASGGNNRIFSAGGTSPGSWTFKSRFDDMIFSSGENSSNPRKIVFETGDVEHMQIGAAGRVGIGNPAIDLSGTALDQLVIGNGTSSQGIVVYHGSASDAGYAFANNTGSITSRILYSSSVDQLRLQYGGTDRLTIGNTKIELLKNTEIDGRLFFGDFSNQGVGTIQIKNEGPNDGIVLWTETNNIITKRIWIDDATNTLQLTAGNAINNGLSLDENGNIGIGTSNPDQALTVKGKIHSEEIIVDLSVPGPDYVFEEDYDLPTLSEIEAFIKANKHLPEVPSAKEMEANGISLGEMNMLLLKKIEELTLHLIQKDQEVAKLAERLSTIEKITKNN